MSISFFDDLGGLFAFWLTFIIQIAWPIIKVEHNPKMSISFFDDLGGLFFTFWLTFIAQSIIRVEHNPKISISFFDDLAAIFLHFGQLSSLSRSSEVERNPKISISFFEDFFQSGSSQIGTLPIANELHCPEVKKIIVHIV